MLQITIVGRKLWDSKNEEFLYPKTQTLCLEHSLVSISKWEQKWKKPFLSKDDKTPIEIIDYIKCMVLTQNVDPNIYLCLTKENIDTIKDYIKDPMTATWFKEQPGPKGSNRAITSEVIYSWMIQLGIEKSYEKWHFNRLMVLIRVCEDANKPKKRQSKRDILTGNAALNAQRRRQLNSMG